MSQHFGLWIGLNAPAIRRQESESAGCFSSNAATKIADGTYKTALATNTADLKASISLKEKHYSLMPNVLSRGPQFYFPRDVCSFMVQHHGTRSSYLYLTKYAFCCDGVKVRTKNHVWYVLVLDR